MNQSSVRLTGITLENFKNVEYGEISFPASSEDSTACVLGVYGQNGSGKTALIAALRLLKLLLSRQAVPPEADQWIKVDAPFARLVFQLAVEDRQAAALLDYGVTLCRADAAGEDEFSSFDGSDSQRRRCRIGEETLSLAYRLAAAGELGPRASRETFFDTRLNEIMPPERLADFFSGSAEDRIRLGFEKDLAHKMGRSFLFSRELLQALRDAAGKENSPQTKADFERAFCKSLLLRLVAYGLAELFVVGTKEAGLVSLNALPLPAGFAGPGAPARGGALLLSLEKPTNVPAESAAAIDAMVSQWNLVLSEMVPGLVVALEKRDGGLDARGRPTVNVEFVSLKNAKKIPLRYESEGIRKIISVLYLLIAVYNERSITVAIDELDSGIFEYLLGEILRILAEQGRGQLIFTSHNLRPLETIDPKFIAFTTTDPKNRYTRLKPGEEHNLRSEYFRDLMLGAKSSRLYQRTNNAKIAHALWKAGQHDE